MNYYCINLSSATDRKLRILNQANKASINIVFIPAIEGKTLNPAKVPEYDRKRRLRSMKDMEQNEIACTLSHKLALQSFLNDPYPYGVIMEDDAIFDTTLAHNIADLVQRVRGFDLLKLESRDSRGTSLGQIGEYNIFLPLKASNGATAILYTKRGAKRLLESLERFHHPIDTHIGFAWGMGILAVACWPPLVTEDRSQPSTIAGRGETKRLAGMRPWLAARKERVVHSVMKRLHFLLVGKRQVYIDIEPVPPTR